MRVSLLGSSGRELASMLPTHRCIRLCPLARLPRHTEVCLSARRNLSARAASEKSSESTSSLDEESRLEALERGVRRRQGAQSVSAAQRKAERISQSSSLPSGGMADWKEGQLFPEGWEDMNAFKKVTELYTGKRGLLFWMGKVTYALIFATIGGWIVFRFVLPQLGILDLKNGLDSMPNY